MIELSIEQQAYTMAEDPRGPEGAKLEGVQNTEVCSCRSIDTTYPRSAEGILRIITVVCLLYVPSYTIAMNKEGIQWWIWGGGGGGGGQNPTSVLEK